MYSLADRWLEIESGKLQNWSNVSSSLLTSQVGSRNLLWQNPKIPDWPQQHGLVELHLHGRPASWGRKLKHLATLTPFLPCLRQGQHLGAPKPGREQRWQQQRPGLQRMVPGLPSRGEGKTPHDALLTAHTAHLWLSLLPMDRTFHSQQSMTEFSQPSLYTYQGDRTTWFSTYLKVSVCFLWLFVCLFVCI